MAGVGKVPKMAKSIVKDFKHNPVKALDPTRVIKRTFNDIGEVMSPDNSAMEAMMKEQMKPIPMADEEELKKSRRRRGNTSTGRASTILTSGDTTKLGG